MKNIIIVCLLAAVACTYSLQATAKSSGNNLNLPIKDSIVSLYNFEDASHELVPLELKTIPIPNQGIKLAAVCSISNSACGGIGFDNNNNGLDLDDVSQCLEEGYELTSCPDNQDPENICPYNYKYFQSCKCPSEYKYSQADCSSSYPKSTIGDSQCTTNNTVYSNACVCDTTTYPYNDSTCNGTEELSGTFCKASTSIDYASACTCIGGNDKYQHTDETCKSSHSGFTNWTINNDVCQNKASDCVCTPNSGDCSSYNLDSDTCTGGSKIGESCNNGCQLKWKCKDLCPYEGTLSSCPEGYVCTLEECSSKFYISGCAIGYTNWCTPPVTDCNILGYNKTVADCTENTFVCPFDNTKVFCNEKIETCEAGDILYSDKSCSKTVVADKTPIAVVFDETKKLALGIEKLSDTIAWYGYGIDIPSLTNCSSEPLNCGTDGKFNTAAIIASGKSNSAIYPAAEYCNTYKTDGTKAGDWFLPSYADLKSIYNSKSKINNSLDLLNRNVIMNSYYWSSTEVNDVSAWVLWMKDGSSNTVSKNYSVGAIAVLAY